MRIAPPPTPALELERLRRAVRAQLFDHEHAPVRIGRFDVVGCLGEGGMGIVYAAVDGELGRTVAIKLLRPEFGGDQRSGRRLTIEAKALARLSHPNVVSVFDVGEHEGQGFIAMEYVDGETLRRWLASDRSTSEIVDVFAHAGRGLAAAHAVGLVHRDFKPDNVLVGHDGRPRVLDFGLARPPDEDDAPSGPPMIDDRDGPMATSLTRDGAMVGTPAYMAPEQHLGDPAGPQSDQFAFCVALWEALTGRLPFDGGDVRTISLSIVAGRRSGSTDRIPARLLGLLDRGLAIRPESRFASMDALLEELERWDERPGSSALATVDMGRAIARAAVDGGGGLPALAHPSPGADVSGLPRLDQAEIAEVLREAGLPVPVSPSPAPEAALVPVAAAPATWELGYQTSVSYAVEVDAMRLPPLRALERTLDRVLHEEGEIEGDAHGVIWSSRRVQVTLEPTPTGTRVLLLRDIARLARRRRRRWMGLSGFGGWMFGIILMEALGMMAGNDGFAMIFVFASTAVGMFSGWSVGRHLHTARAEHEHEQLRWAAERVAALPGS
jgi:predicted Ser/Thr protein kinase